MVNVATAGGYIDYWGAYPQADYEEYTITQDEWGYVFLEVDAGNNPKFTLKRLSIGDDFITKNNCLSFFKACLSSSEKFHQSRFR